MGGFFATILGIMVILLPFVLIALDIVFIVKKKEKAWFEVVAFLLAGVYISLVLSGIFLVQLLVYVLRQ